MRLPRRRARDVSASIEAAAQARDDANERLAAARDAIAVQGERARAERATIIAALKRMRAQNNLGRMILDAVEREAGDDAGATGSRSH